MEVTKENFNEMLPQIKEAIDSADFVAFDVEFTANSEKNISIFDTPELRYARSTNSQCMPIVCQFGLSTFKFNKQRQCYNVHCFNAYVYPNVNDQNRRLLAGTGVELFSSNPSCLLFLQEHGFDFNAWLSRGVPFLRQDAYDLAKELIVHRYNKDKLSIMYLNNIKLIQTRIQNEIRLVTEFLKSEEKVTTLISKWPWELQSWIILTYGHVAFLTYEKCENGYEISIQKCNGEKEFQALSDRFLSTTIDKNIQLGFTVVLKHLIESKKPIVGHKMYSDLLYIYNCFIGPLPKTWFEFKESVNKLFPVMYDTKLILLDTKLKEIIPRRCLKTAYGELLRKFAHKKPFDESSFSSAKGPMRAHQAAYDALLTGKLFILLTEILSDYGGASKANHSLTFEWSLLNSVVNKVQCDFSDISHVSFASGAQTLPDRSNVLYLKLENSLLLTPAIHQMFAANGFYKVRANWRSNRFLFIVMKCADEAKAVLESFKKHPIAWQGHELIGYEQFIESEMEEVSQ